MTERPRDNDNDLIDELTELPTPGQSGTSGGTRSMDSLSKATKRPSPLSDTSRLPSVPPVASTPPVPTLTRVVTPVCRSWRKTSRVPLLSGGTRSMASDVNATSRPSALMATSPPLSPMDSPPPVATLTRLMAPVCRSWTKTSGRPFVSPGTRFAAWLQNAT